MSADSALLEEGSAQATLEESAPSLEVIQVGRTPVVPGGIELVGEGDFAVPRRLPVRSISHSSIKLWKECPEKWHRKYVLDQEEPSRIYFATGKAVGGGIARYVGECLGESVAEEADREAAKVINGRPELREAFGDRDDPQLLRVAARAVESFDLELEEVELLGDDDPDKLRVAVLEPTLAYCEQIASELEPLAVERKVRFGFPEAEWKISAYLDIEYRELPLVDIKTSASKHTKRPDLIRSRQLRIYALGRKAEGDADPSDYLSATIHSGRIGNIKEETRRWELLEPVLYTEELLAEQMREIARVAREIAVAAETGEYRRADGEGFVCKPGVRGCPFWSDCPGGGKLLPGGSQG